MSAFLGIRSRRPRCSRDSILHPAKESGELAERGFRQFDA
jgi:hypothetical protein